jgi:hypothetical protein
MASRKRDRNDEEPRRKANSVISLTQFAHSKSKGTRKAIEKYKQKKQAKFNHNAQLLKQYKKVMKKEGFEAGKGASRKRNKDDLEDGERSSKKRVKADPFAKAKRKAQQAHLDSEKRIIEREEQKEKQSEKEKQKKLRARKLSQRTKKGQPIMKNMIGDMLEKIKSDMAK